MKRTEDVQAELQAARRAWPLGTRLSHKKGGQYVIVGHGFDTEREEVSVAYQRFGGPGFDPIAEMGIILHRPVSMFTEDRFREIR